MSTKTQPRLSLYNPRVRRPRPRPAPPAERAFTSRQAAQISEVPFFTIDYWSRTKFLVPTVAAGQGRGKGRQRMYSYGDVIRLRIARELRDQKVSLETLRAVVQKLSGYADDLPRAHFVLVGNNIEMAASLDELAAILRRPGRQTFGVILDLRTLTKTLRQRARALAAADSADRSRP